MNLFANYNADITKFVGIANDDLLNRIIKQKQENRIQSFKSINVMESQGIQPTTLGKLHKWFSEQGICYFGMSLTTEHAVALTQAAHYEVDGICSMQTQQMFSACGNLWNAESLSGG